MKKILFLGPSFDFVKGGAEYQYQIMEQHLKKAYNIFYLFRYPESIEKNNIITYDYRFRKNYNGNLPTDTHIIYKLIKKLSPDIIYKQGVDYSAAVGVYYAKKKGINFLLHIASSKDVELNEAKLNRAFLFDLMHNYISKYVIRNSSKILCQAVYQNLLLKKNFERFSDLILPNFQPFPTENIKKDKYPITIIWIANFKRLKQPELFIRLSNLLSDIQEARFVMIGRPATGDWQSKLNKQIETLKNLEYLGELTIDHVNKNLSRAHILVNTSHYEGFSNTYIQAWMRRVPVVALNSDPDDIIKTNRLGFHSKSFNQLVADVKTLIKNHSLREKMGEEAQTFALQTFSTKNIDSFVKILEEL